MKWVRIGTSVALVAILSCASCGSFSADNGADAGLGDAGGGGDAGDGGACVPGTCAGDGPSCSFHDFENGCGLDFTFASGDTGKPGVVGECKAGKAHVAATNTLDMIAELEVKTPGAYQSIRVSASVSVTSWTKGRVLTVQLDQAIVAEIDVVFGPSGRPQFNLCNAGNCAGEPFVSEVGAEHLFVFDITSTSVSLRVDCLPFASRAAQIELVTGANLFVSFGQNGGNPMDGTIDNLLVAYR